MSIKKNNVFKGAVKQITTAGVNQKPKVISLNSNKAVILWNEVSGACKFVKVAEINTSTGSIEYSFNLGSGNCDVKGGALLRYDDSKYVVSWIQKESKYESYIKVYSNGSPISNAQKLYSQSEHDIESVSLARLGTNDFEVSWNTKRLHGDHYHYEVRGEIYELNTGNALDDYRVLSLAGDSQDTHDNAKASAYANGRSVITWREENGNKQEIRAKIFKGDYNAFAADFKVNVNSYDSYDQDSAVANDRALIVWTSDGQDGNGKGVVGTIFDSSGIRVGTEFIVNTVTLGNQFDSRVISIDGDKFLIHWISNNEEIVIKAFNYSGAPLNLGCTIINAQISESDYDVAISSDNKLHYVWIDNANVFLGIKPYSNICDVTSTVSGSSTDSITPDTTLTKSVTDEETLSSSVSTDPTEDKTQSASKSITGVETASNTITDTDTNSISESRTQIGTSSASVSASVTKSDSASTTESATDSATTTESKTVTGALSDSISASDTSTASLTSTITQTATNSASASASITQTETNTASTSASSTQTLTDTESASLSNSLEATVSGSLSISNTDTLTQSGTVTKSDTLTQSGTVTKSGTQSVSTSQSGSESVSGTVSVTDTATSTDSSSVSQTDSSSLTESSTKDITATITHTNTGSDTKTNTDTATTSYTSTNSISSSGTVSTTKTLDDTASGTVSATSSGTISTSTSKTISRTETETQTASSTSSVSAQDSMTTTISNSASVSGTHSQTLTDTNTESDTFSLVNTQSKTESISGTISSSDTITTSDTQTVSVTDEKTQSASLPETMSQTHSIRCDKKEATVSFVYDNFEIVSVNQASSRKYDVVTTREVKNSFNNKITTSTKLVIDREIRDYINSFRDDTQEDEKSYVDTGTVSYSNHCANDALVESSFADIEKRGFNDQAFTTYDWYTQDPLRNYCVSKWNSFHVEQSVDVPLDPGQCVIARMTASFYQDIDVSYKSRVRFTAIDKFGNKMKGDALISAARCVIKQSLPWGLVEHGSKVEFYTTGIIKHTDLGDVKVDLSECSNSRTMVRVSLVYRDFSLQIPQDLTPYNTTTKSSERFVNALKYGVKEFAPELSLNIKTTNSITGFRDDIALNDDVLGGKVVYERQYTKDLTPLNAAGYTVDASAKDPEFDWFDSQKTSTTNLLSQHDLISLKKEIKISLAPNKCANAQITAYLYKEVPIPYTAKGYVTITDIAGYPIVGSKLTTIASRIFSKPVTLGRNNEVTFNANGILNHNILHNVETALTECSPDSPLQSPLNLPMVYVKLNYRDFVLQTPSDVTPYSSTMRASKNFVNANDRGTADFDTKLRLSMPLVNSMTSSFHEDVLSNDNVLGGRVSYARQNMNDYVARNGVATGYSIGVETQDIEFEWFDFKKTLTTNMFSQWGVLNIEDKVKTTLLPNKCSQAEMTASIYKKVEAPYTAKGYVTLTDIEGNPIVGEQLVKVASSIFSRPVTLEKNSEVVFNVEGTISYNMLNNVEVSVKPCESLSPLQSPDKLPKVIVSLSYRDFAFTIPQDYQQHAQEISSTKKVLNNKRYGSLTYKVPTTLEVQLSQSFDSFYNDVKPNNLVVEGRVSYSRKYDDINLLFGNNLSGYKLSENIGDLIEHDWFASRDKVSSELFSHLNKASITNDAEVVLVPRQCVYLKTNATLYNNVEVLYSAKGYFTAKTQDGYSVSGEQLIAVAQHILNKDVELNSNGEAVFETSGTLVHNLIGNIETHLLDC